MLKVFSILMLAAVVLSFNVNAQEGTGRGGGDPILDQLHQRFPGDTDCEIAAKVDYRIPGEDMLLDTAASDPVVQDLIEACSGGEVTPSKK